MFFLPAYQGGYLLFLLSPSSFSSSRSVGGRGAREDYSGGPGWAPTGLRPLFSSSLLCWGAPGPPLIWTTAGARAGLRPGYGLSSLLLFSVGARRGGVGGGLRRGPGLGPHR